MYVALFLYVCQSIMVVITWLHTAVLQALLATKIASIVKSSKSEITRPWSFEKCSSSSYDIHKFITL